MVKVVVSNYIIDKLKTSSTDIKTYVNINAAIAQGSNHRIMFSEEDINELLAIRHRQKALAYKLQNQMRTSI